jgi:hypothetical protein
LLVSTPSRAGGVPLCRRSSICRDGRG